MRGRKFKGTPEAMAAYQPFIGLANLTHKGVPIGYNLHTGELVWFHPFMLPTNTTSISIEGEKNAGKSVFAKSMTLRLAMCQARDVNGELESWRTRITSRRSEDGVAEYAPVADYLRGATTKLGKGNRINLFGLLISPTDVINACVNVVQEIGGRRNDVKIAPAVTIATYRLFEMGHRLVSERMLAEVLKTLKAEDFVEYLKTIRRDSLAEFEDEFKADSQLRSQLNLDVDISYADDSYVAAAVHAAECLEVLMSGQFGDVFGGKVSLRDALMQPVVMLDTEELPENANTMLESVMMRAETSAIQYSKEDIGTDRDMTRIVPHLNISDEEGVAMKSVMHARYLANFEARARAYATSRWRLSQYSTQMTDLGNAGSELRSLAAEIDRGVGARFIFRQVDDPAILQRFSQLGLSDQIVERLPFLDPGEGVLLVRDKPPVMFKHQLTSLELPMIESNSSRMRLTAVQPVYEMDEYVEQRDQLLRVQQKQLELAEYRSGES